MTSHQNREICLETNDPEKSLILKDIRRFSDGSGGYESEISVRSGWLTFSHIFYFDDWHLRRALAQLSEMSHGATGVVTIKETWEHDFVSLKLDQMGHVWVSGEIGHLGGPDQQTVCFYFQTDQTVIPSFTRDLSALVSDT